jgi:hypothetical protein
MTMKRNLFGCAAFAAFALGLGISFGVGAAQSCGVPCQTACTAAFNRCIASGIGRDKCFAQATACLSRCRCPVP